MKKKLFFLSIIFATSFTSFGQNTLVSVSSQDVVIPNAIFKAALVANTSINTNGDTEIQVTEANSYTGGIGVSGKNISDLTGIEAFTEIVTLQAFNNPITSIDLSQNTKLKQILLEDTSISGTLDLSMMPNLTDFKGHTTGLTAVNMANGNNSNVTRFDISSTSVTCVQVDTGFTPSNNWTTRTSSIYTEACNEFSTTATLTTSALNGTVSANIQPTNGAYNKGTVVELTASPDAGYQFDSWSGDVTSTMNPLSITINTDSNITAVFKESLVTLTTIASANGTVQVNTQPTNGTYANGTVVELTAIPDAGYILHSWSGDVTSTTNPLSITMDADKSITATFSQNVVIPDANFKAALVANTSINTNGDTEIQVNEANSYTGSVSVSGKSISDLTGIEAFTEIVALQAFSNPITSVDLSKNTKLKQLLLESTSISGTLDLSMLPSLTDFKAHTTGLTAVNMANGNNSSVTRFDISSTSVSCVQIDAGFTPNNNWTTRTSSIYTEACIEFSSTAGVVDKTFNNAIKVYPNPVISTLDINIATEQEFEKAQIFNLLGKEVLATSNTTVDMSGFASGIYLLKIESREGKVAVRKIVKK